MRVPRLTPEQVDALEKGPAFYQIEENGVRRVARPEVQVLWHEKDDPMAQPDSAGRLWRIGAYADGSLFKH